MCRPSDPLNGQQHTPEGSWAVRNLQKRAGGQFSQLLPKPLANESCQMDTRMQNNESFLKEPL